MVGMSSSRQSRVSGSQSPNRCSFSPRRSGTSRIICMVCDLAIVGCAYCSKVVIGDR